MKNVNVVVIWQHVQAASFLCLSNILYGQKHLFLVFQLKFYRSKRISFTSK